MEILFVQVDAPLCNLVKDQLHCHQSQQTHWDAAEIVLLNFDLTLTAANVLGLFGQNVSFMQAKYLFLQTITGDIWKGNL